MYAKVENNTLVEYPLFENDIKSRYPNVSWVAGEFAPPLGYVEVYYDDTPTYDSSTQTVVQGSVEHRDDGKWYQTWTVIDMNSTEQADRLAVMWAVVRADRNAKLQESDWTQVNDAPVDQAAWAVYRQALRDITEQSDPFNIIWPTPPE